MSFLYEKKNDLALFKTLYCWAQASPFLFFLSFAISVSFLWGEDSVTQHICYASEHVQADEHVQAGSTPTERCG